MASSMIWLKSSAVMVESTSFMASFRAVLPLLDGDADVDLAARPDTGSYRSVPEKSRIIRSS